MAIEANIQQNPTVAQNATTEFEIIKTSSNLPFFFNVRI
jgi:hypothetical protein